MLYRGEVIKGEWNKNRYIVLKKIGQGGIGSVYKVKDSRGRVKAIKISGDISSITREYENMKKFKALRIIPKAYEIDDYKKYGETFHFFTLDYIDGYNLKQIIKARNVDIQDSINIVMIILKNLKIIYDYGYIYSDIKLENIMISKRDRKVYLIDFGGVVDKSLGLKEYTPTYNIVSWGLDNQNQITSMIFSVNMLLTSMILRQEPSPLVKSIKDVEEEIKNKTIKSSIKKTMKNALNGRSGDIDKYITDLENIILNKGVDLDIINLIFKGSILSFLVVITINVIINWM